MKKTICLILSVIYVSGLFSACNYANDSQSITNESLSTAQNSLKLPDNNIIELANLIITSSLNIEKLNEPFNERQIDNFVYNLCSLKLEGNKNNPYIDIVSIKEDDYLHAEIYEKDLQKMIYEVFGVKDWSLSNSEETIQTNSNNERYYYLILELGIDKTSYCPSNQEVKYGENNEVVVVFAITDANSFEPKGINYGSYKIVFHSIQENGTNNLRYIRCEQVLE